jgi:hypothetical protein
MIPPNESPSRTTGPWVRARAYPIASSTTPKSAASVASPRRPSDRPWPWRSTATVAYPLSASAVARASWRRA